MLLWSFWNAERKVKVFLYNGTELSYKNVFKQQASASESNDRIYCVSSARSEAQVIYNIRRIQYSESYPTFLSDI